MTWFLLTLAPRPGGQEMAASPGEWDLAARAGQAIGRTLGGDDLRAFASLGIAAVRAPRDSADRLRALPGVLAVVGEPSWYMGLIEAWEHVIERAAALEASVVNLSLAPPDAGAQAFDPHEPLNRATRIAHRRGIVTVVAVGNDGRRGAGTMSRWARAPWVIGVGASDAEGRAVEPYSSRGVPCGDEHPLVVAPGVQEPPTGDFGTSFAAPVVSDIAVRLAVFLLRLWQQGGQPLGSLQAVLPALVRGSLERMARPIPGDRHERGAGVVSGAVARDFILGLTTEQARALFGAGAWLDQRALSAAQVEAMAPDTLPAEHRVGRFTIDSTYEWTGPAFVPGLLRYERCFLLRLGDEFAERGHIRTATIRRGLAEFVEISVAPAAPQERRLTVRQDGSGDFATIGRAIEEAGDGDVIEVGPGIYEEAVRLPSGVTLLGEEGTVIRHASAPPVIIDDARGVALVGVRVEASGPRCAAVMVTGGASIVCRRCRLVSHGGNAAVVERTRRVAFSECVLEGAINAAYLLWSREGLFDRTICAGARGGVLLYGASARFVRCDVMAGDGDGIVFIPPAEPWTDRREALVYTYPVGSHLLDPAEVSPAAAGRDDFCGYLARYLYALQLSDSTLRGSRVALAATDGGLVRAERCVAGGGQHDCATIRGERPLPVTPAPGEPWARVVQAVNDSLRLAYMPCECPGIEPLATRRDGT